MANISQKGKETYQHDLPATIDITHGASESIQKPKFEKPSIGDQSEFTSANTSFSPKAPKGKKGALAQLEDLPAALAKAITKIYINPKLVRSLAVALIALSGFAEKQTQKDNIPEEQRQAILQIGTLGYTVFRMDVEKGSMLDRLTPNHLRGILAEPFKEMLDNFSKSVIGPHVRLYDSDVNKTSEEKDIADGTVRIDPFNKNPIKDYNSREKAEKESKSQAARLRKTISGNRGM